jgi:hypothetical protein
MAYLWAHTLDCCMLGNAQMHAFILISVWRIYGLILSDCSVLGHAQTKVLKYKFEYTCAGAPHTAYTASERICEFIYTIKFLEF